MAIQLHCLLAFFLTKLGEQSKAIQAQENMVVLFKQRKVTPLVIDNAEKRLNQMKGVSSSRVRGSRRPK
jgi:hypothetical protein